MLREKSPLQFAGLGPVVFATSLYGQTAAATHPAGYIRFACFFASVGSNVHRHYDVLYAQTEET